MQTSFPKPITTHCSYAIVTCVMILFMSCMPLKKNTPFVYSRSKAIDVNGTLTALTGSNVMTVTFKYSSHNPRPEIQGTTEILDDCFRSTLVYEGVTDNHIEFRICEYLCSTAEPVSMSRLSLSRETDKPILLTFHGMNLIILSADEHEVHMKSCP